MDGRYGSWPLTDRVGGPETCPSPGRPGKSGHGHWTYLRLLSSTQGALDARQPGPHPEACGPFPVFPCSSPQVPPFKAHPKWDPFPTSITSTFNLLRGHPPPFLPPLGTGKHKSALSTPLENHQYEIQTRVHKPKPDLTSSHSPAHP